MKLSLVVAMLIISSLSFADRGPYFESFEKAPLAHGKLIFASYELEQINSQIYFGEVLVQKYKGGFEVAPMLYKCAFNYEDGSLGCKFLRYEIKNAKSYKDCEVFNNDYFNCY